MIQPWFLMACGAFLPHASDDDPPREFGDVHWQRRLEAALTASKKSEKPVLLLFQEVPG